MDSTSAPISTSMLLHQFPAKTLLEDSLVSRLPPGNSKAAQMQVSRSLREVACLAEDKAGGDFNYIHNSGLSEIETNVN